MSNLSTWKNRCDPKNNGGLPIPSVRRLFSAPVVELALFHGGGTVNINILPLGAHTLLLGSTRSGKSNTGGLLVENIHPLPDPATGGCAIPTFIADFQGEYRSVFTLYPQNVFFIEEIIESEEEVEVKKGRWEKVYKTHGARDAKKFCEGRITYHFNIAPFNGRIMLAKQYILDFLTECNNIKTAEYMELQKISPGKLPRPHLFYFSEAHNYFPQEMPGAESGNPISKNLKDIGIAIARGGLKLGMPCIFDSQRPSQFEKDVSTQCINRILLPVIDRPDLEYYADLLPHTPFATLKIKMDEMWQPQNKGTAIFRVPGSGSGLSTVRFFKKESIDLGGTPNFSSAIDWNYGGDEPAGTQQAYSGQSVGTSQDSEADPYKVLQVDRSASNKQIEAAWRRQLIAWHPDRFFNDPDMFEEAQERTKKINWAHDQIKKERGR